MRGKIGFDKLAFGVLLLYSMMNYISYINPKLNAIHSLLLYILMLLCIVRLFLKGYLSVNKYIKWYLSFTILCGFSIIYTPNRAGALEILKSQIVILGLTFCFITLIKSKEMIESFMNSIFWGSIVLLLYLLITGNLNNTLDSAGRFGGILTGNANIFASLYMFACFTSIYFWEISSKKNKKIMYFAGLLFQFYALILSGGRKFFILPIIMFFLMFIQHQDYKGRKHTLKYCIIGIIIAIVIIYIVFEIPFLYENIGYRIEDFTNHFLYKTQMEDTGTIKRGIMMERAFKLWINKPIFGNGSNAFYLLGGFEAYSHTNYLELLCNYGIVGFIWYYSFYIYCINMLLKIKDKDVMVKFFIDYFVCIMIFEVIAIDYNTNFTHIFLSMAVLYANIKRNNYRKHKIELEKINE